MRNLTATICLTIAVLLGSTGMSWSGDPLKVWNQGLEAHKRGDYQTALKVWMPLAMRGEAAVQNMVASMYAVGQGTKKNPSLAFSWFSRAAEQGLAVAQVAAGRYLSGISPGVAIDHKKAVFWFRKAAEQGSYEGQSFLSVMYYQGLGGLLQDRVMAYMWSNIATANAAGTKDAKTIRNLRQELYGKDLTADQIAEGQKLARECVRKKYKGC